MDLSPTDELLRHAARRARGRPFFLASALADYQAWHGLDDRALSAHLGCRSDVLPKLALCRRPSGEGADFRAAVERVAAYAGVDALRLAQLLREADAWAALHSAPSVADPEAPGFLLAARDRREEPPSDTPAAGRS